MKYWIARDKDLGLFLYTEDEPKRSDDIFVLHPYGKARFFEIDKNDFPEITWENSPMEVEFKLK